MMACRQTSEVNEISNHVKYNHKKWKQYKNGHEVTK